METVNDDTLATVLLNESVCLELSVISYNMHGYNQGYQTVRDLVCDVKPDIFLLQEHWLTPSNLNKFEHDFVEYVCIGSSAMSAAVESGVLRGRPFSGVMTLVNKKHEKYVKVVCAADRYAVVVVGDLLILNVYLPCDGTND